MDSGTKNKRRVRLLSFLLLAVLLVAMSSFSVFAEEADPAQTNNSVAETLSQAEGTAGGSSTAFPSGFQKLPEGASLGERLMYGLQVAGIGLLVVFLVLIIIMAILYIFKLVALSKTKASQPAAASPAPAVSKSTAAPAPAVSGSEEETVVAIATAAIAASRGESDCAFRVISVTKLQ